MLTYLEIGNLNGEIVYGNWKSITKENFVQSLTQ